jgi:hypothetical protein
MLFGSKPKVGTALIDDTIGQFESFAEKLETGARQNTEKVFVNEATIAALSAENAGLIAAQERAANVAAKLRSLVS